ncbi:MAG: Crp/Fnr family transcriptional regulator [Boseongicola sp.]|nr:Crp/Fnr family transcriptional regulator [Boseongicola sp.]
MHGTQNTLCKHGFDPSLISDLPPFRALSVEDIGTILEHSARVVVSSGGSFFYEGDDADRFFLLLDGYVRVVRITEHGEQIVALHIAAGQLFGIAKALSRNTYPATAEAARDCFALSWPTSLWDTFGRDYPGFLTETYRIVGFRVGEMNDRIVEMATLHVEQRIANALLRLVNQAGKATEHGIEIDFPITRRDVSEMTGTTLHTVSRLLSAWESEGLVISGRRKIIVSQPHLLMERASATHQ